MTKYVIVMDTLCMGWQAQEDEEGNPILYNTMKEADLEILDNFNMMNSNRIDSGDEPDEEPEEFVMPLDEYVKGRKSIFYGKDI